MSEMYKRKRVGLSTAPWGTPAWGVKGDEMAVETLILI